MSRSCLETARLVSLRIKPYWESSRSISTAPSSQQTPFHLDISLLPRRHRSFGLQLSGVRRDLIRHMHCSKISLAEAQRKTQPVITSPRSEQQRNVASSNEPDEDPEELHESPYTIPNALTLARICACPFLGYTIVNGQYAWATGILLASGFSDWLDGYIARKYSLKSVLGSILDPAADKALMTTLVVTLAWSGLLPLPLAVLILGRDIALSISAFYFRYISLPRPRTLKRYFDPSIPSAEVKPTQISKINTALQLGLMGVTTISPLLTIPIAAPLGLLQWTVAGTTIWSGLSYVNRAGVKILQKSKKT